MNSHLKTLKVGMIGCGVVGSEVARLLIENSEDLAARSGAHLELAAIAVRDLSLKRPGIDPALLTTDAESIVNDPSIDIIIELAGGIEPARSLILTAFKNKKSVVTANKALLAKHGAELYETAGANGEDI